MSPTRALLLPFTILLVVVFLLLARYKSEIFKAILSSTSFLFKPPTALTVFMFKQLLGHSSTFAKPFARVRICCLQLQHFQGEPTALLSFHMVLKVKRSFRYILPDDQSHAWLEARRSDPDTCSNSKGVIHSGDQVMFLIG